MYYVIDRYSQIPAYYQLYELLRQDIIEEVYPYGSKLPSKRIMAAETGVSVITVEHAYNLLSDEGYLEVRPRGGSYIVFKKKDFQGTPAGHQPEKSVVPKSHSKSEFPFTVLARTMRKVLLDYDDRILVKAPSHGCEELRTEICSYLARSRAIHVDPSQVVIGSGAEYLYGLIAQMFDPGETIGLENPSYDKIRKVYESMGVSCEMLTMREDGIDSEELRNTKAIVLHTTPFNSYPSGITASAEKKQEYLAWANERGGIVIEDNYNSELAISHKPEDSLFAMSGGRRVIYMNTFTKTIAPSVRVGYMILPEDQVEFFNERLGFYSCTVPVFEQYVLAELLKNGDFERHVNRIRNRKRKELKGTT